MQLIEVQAGNCTGCRLCEMACSLVHEGECSTARSRIRVFRDEEFGNNLISVCLHCADPCCIESCLYGALNRDSATGVVGVDTRLCIGCGDCIVACPLSILDKDRATVLKCDLCGGDPECVKVCFSGALVLKDLDPGAPARKSLRDETSQLLQQMQGSGKPGNRATSNLGGG